MNKKFVKLVVILMAIGISILNQAQSGELNMFSFFSSNKNKTSTTINPLIGAELIPETQFPQVHSNVTIPSHCRKMHYEGQPPATQFITKDIVETPDLAFIIDGLFGKNPLALINNPDEGRFDIWNLDATTLKPTLPINIGTIHPRQNNWSSFFILDIACLPNNKILIAVGYDDPTTKYALFLFDAIKSSISLIEDIDRNIPEIENYFEYKVLNDDTALVLYYSDTKRESAEIYQNYYNHIMLFNSEHSQGLKVLKLGIDIGNITEWTVENKILFMKTIDMRGHQEPKKGLWSLNLSKVLK